MIVSVERHDGIAVLTLNDPQRRNILTAGLVEDLSTAMDGLENDGTTRAVVITGKGSAFCAGAELATLERAAGGDFSLIRKVYAGFLRVMHSPLLTVGAINGPAVGAGFNLALACDLRIAAPGARFVCRFSELRILPGGGHAWMLTRAVGRQRAMQAILLGHTWSAEESLADGLTAKLVDADRLVTEAIELVRPVQSLEPEYVRRLVGSVRVAPEIADHATALDLEARDQEWSVGRPAFLDGLDQIRTAIAKK